MEKFDMGKFLQEAGVNIDTGNRKQISHAEMILRQSGLLVYPRIRRNNNVDNVTFDRELANARTGHMRDYKRFVTTYAMQGGVGHGKG